MHGHLPHIVGQVWASPNAASAAITEDACFTVKQNGCVEREMWSAECSNYAHADKGCRCNTFSISSVIISVKIVIFQKCFLPFSNHLFLALFLHCVTINLHSKCASFRVRVSQLPFHWFSNAPLIDCWLALCDSLSFGNILNFKLANLKLSVCVCFVLCVEALNQQVLTVAWAAVEVREAHQCRIGLWSTTLSVERTMKKVTICNFIYFITLG